jgi:sirohydrochlorin ferrochelatase
MTPAEHEALGELPAILAVLTKLSEAVDDPPLARALRFASDHVGTALRRAQALTTTTEEVA